MAVTAQVWEEAHAYHRLQLEGHQALAHTPGILTGLQVIASDPADTSVYILPGMALSPEGKIIIVEEAVTYNLGRAQGALRLLLGYDESVPRAEEISEEERLYIHTQFGIEAQEVNAGTGVELARVYRSDGETPVRDAERHEAPKANEIDLRFRREAAPMQPTGILLGVINLGDPAPSHREGALALGRALRQRGTPLWVDPEVSLGTDLQPYHILYLVGQGKFEMDREEMTALYEYLEQGGFVLIESCGDEDAAAQAETAFRETLDSLGIPLTPVEQTDVVYHSPHLFAESPEGCRSLAAGEPYLLSGTGVLLSRADYGCLWQGRDHDGPVSRETIRTAQEFGENWIHHAQRQPAPDRK